MCDNYNKECICKAPYSQITCFNALFTKVFKHVYLHIIIQENSCGE